MNKVWYSIRNQANGVVEQGYIMLRGKSQFKIPAWSILSKRMLPVVVTLVIREKQEQYVEADLFDGNWQFAGQ